MSGLLIVTQNRELKESCRNLLRGTGLRSIFTEDIIDGMKELNWFGAALIIWEIQPNILREMKALSVLKTKYRRTPLLLIVDNHEFSDVLRDFADEVILKKNVSKELTKRVNTLVGNMANTALESN